MSQPSPSSSGLATPSNGRISRLRRGVGLGLPIFLGYAPVGVAFGIVARSEGWSTLQAVVCSATAIAGAGQFIGLSVLSAGSGVLAALSAVAVVNLRYVLFGSTLSPHLSKSALHHQAFLGFTLTDETFAVNVADIKAGTASPASMAGVGAIAWCGWVLGTLVGAAGAGWISDPSKWGVEFAMPAMFTALFVALADDWRHVVTGAFAAAVVICLPLLGQAGIPVPESAYVIVGSIVASIVATAVFKDAE